VLLGTRVMYSLKFSLGVTQAFHRKYDRHYEKGNQTGVLAK
jgi:hypothetical protein